MSRIQTLETPAGPATLKRSSRRTLAISVLPDGSLELVAPEDATEEAILAKIAKDRGVSLPTKHNEEARATVNRLTPLKGKEFDEALMWFESEEQPNVLAMYRWQYENCTDAAVKQFVSSTMPIIGTHQRMAESIHQDVNEEGIRIAAERKAAELKAEQDRQAAAAAEAAAATAKRSTRRFGQKKGATMVVPAPAPASTPAPPPEGSAAAQPTPGPGST